MSGLFLRNRDSDRSAPLGWAGGAFFVNNGGRHGRHLVVDWANGRSPILYMVRQVMEIECAFSENMSNKNRQDFLLGVPVILPSLAAQEITFPKADRNSH